jgi:membrane protein DedA with SNARE-associated domain
MSPKSKTVEKPQPPITRHDIVATFGVLRGEVDDRTQAAKVPAIAVAVGAAVLTVVVAYWFGKRKGKKRQMVLEIRRI